MSKLEHGSFIDLLMKKRKLNETEDNQDDNNKSINNKQNNNNNLEQKKTIKEKKENKTAENQEEQNNINPEGGANIPIIEQTNEDACLNYLPMTNNYFISYLQSDVIDNIYCTNKTYFIFTTSYDGAIQFWKKIPKGIEFVKKFKAHLNKITGLSINKEGSLLCTCSQKDLFLKIFDIINFDLFDYTQLNYYPSLCEFIIADSKSISNIIAISEKDKGIIHIYDSNKKKEISLVTIHNNSIITGIKFNMKFNICLSTSNLGLIEYWSKSANKNKKVTVNDSNNINNNNIIFGNENENETIDDSISFDFPKHSVKFKFKSQTDLFKLYNKKKKKCHN
jgi:peptidylprolyl isomerase domain and WD repeat-containing protein 1